MYMYLLLSFIKCPAPMIISVTLVRLFSIAHSELTSMRLMKKNISRMALLWLNIQGISRILLTYIE